MPPTDTDVMAPGEVGRTLLRLEEGIKDIAGKLERRPSWTALERLEEARDARDKIRDAEIAELKDSHRWVTRAVIGALITGLVGLVLASSLTLGQL